MDGNGTMLSPRSVSLGGGLSGRVEVVKRDGGFQQETGVMGEKGGCLVMENVLSSRKEPGSLGRQSVWCGRMVYSKNERNMGRWMDG